MARFLYGTCGSHRLRNHFSVWMSADSRSFSAFVRAQCESHNLQFYTERLPPRHEPTQAEYKLLATKQFPADLKFSCPVNLADSKGAFLALQAGQSYPSAFHGYRGGSPPPKREGDDIEELLLTWAVAPQQMGPKQLPSR